MAPPLLDRLKQRKLVQWMVAYLAGAWLVLQAMSVLAVPFGWPGVVLRVTTLVLGVGALAALVLAWYHGEKGAQRVSGSELVIIAVLLVAAGFGVARMAATREPASNPAATTGDGRPLVLMMDSPHPSRVYDSLTLASNGTNADVLSDILLDLPIHRQKESIGPNWHREEEIRRFDPDLIMIHWSGFCQETCTDRTRLMQLVEYFADSKTRFLIYSRAREDSLRLRVDSLLHPVQDEHHGILKRVSVFGLNDHGTPHWHDPATASAIKLRVKKLLGLR